MRLRLESVRARLAIFHVGVLGVVLLVVGGLIYFLLARVLYARIDEGLLALIQTTATSLSNDLAEGQDLEDAARSTAAELSSRRQLLAIHDEHGRLLAESGRPDKLAFELPAAETIPSSEARLLTVAELRDRDDRHRLALRRVALPRQNAVYIVVAGSSLEPTDEELEALRRTLAYVVPVALTLAGIGGWLLAHRSLAPVVAMADRARQIGGEDLSGRLPVANPHDELGRLAASFNELLARLEAAMTQQRQFMADASHELRTPVTTTRTAANVALQQPHREEEEYRRTLQIVELQAVRLSRLVEDMFTLARADAGTYPVRMQPMYLDEVIEEVVAASRVIASTRNVKVELESLASVAYVGDQDLIRRLVANLLDNAVRHSPAGSSVRVELAGVERAYRLTVADRGSGIPAEHQSRVFERFYRVEAGRERVAADGGAGLGLALARWVARIHGGDVTIVHSSRDGSIFAASLPDRR